MLNELLPRAGLTGVHHLEDAERGNCCRGGSAAGLDRHCCRYYPHRAPEEEENTAKNYQNDAAEEEHHHAYESCYCC